MRNIILSLSLVLSVFSCEVGKDTNSQSPSPAEEGTNSDDPEDTSPQVDGETGDAGDEEPAPETDSDPVVVRPIQLSIKYSHTCALLRSSGEVKCWGRGDRGQLGTGDIDNRNLGDEANEMGESLVAISLGEGRTAKAVSAGWEHTCAILDDDTVKCWGFGIGGRLGQGNGDLIGDAKDEIKDLASINLGKNRTAKAVSAGGKHTCAILDNDMVKCWGTGEYGVLGNGKEDNLGDGGRRNGKSPLCRFWQRSHC